MSEVMVKNVTGRRKALARSLALEAVRLQGQDWFSLSRSEQRRVIADANKIIGSWIATGVLLEFEHPWRGP